MLFFALYFYRFRLIRNNSYHKMQHIYYYVGIFATGVVCSILMMNFAANIFPNERKIRNFLSDEHYLQVRDDYSIFSLAPNQLVEHENGQRKRISSQRNDLEGIRRILLH